MHNYDPIFSTHFSQTKHLLTTKDINLQFIKHFQQDKFALFLKRIYIVYTFFNHHLWG